eukprot:TRINITY_DN11690_c0_g1_i1.p1 TRINITY_DN11690_c0_g1~~TRINITY_DN11690_c0_g1_i1.p1  ORF type:complete len:563 (+),score=170.88 TRINITY_DN11690_c0_g1_i1:56-1690(+)
MMPMMPGRIGATGMAIPPAGREELSSETVVAVLVTYWSAVRGPTHSLIFLEQRTNMPQEELDFLGRFALLSAVAHNEKGSTFTVLQELDVGVTSVLFQAMCPVTKMDVQYCLSVAVRSECIDRYVSLSTTVNERLDWVVDQLTMALSRDPDVDELVGETAPHVASFLQHLDVWMQAVVPPCSNISETIFGDDNLTTAEKDFIASAITAHCTCHQRSLIVSSSPVRINKWIRTLCLVSTPEVAHCSLLINDESGDGAPRRRRRKTKKRTSQPQLDTTESNLTLPQGQGASLLAGTPSDLNTPLDVAETAALQSTARSFVTSPANSPRDYGSDSYGDTPDLYLQGMVSRPRPAVSDEVPSRYSPCVLDVDNKVIYWPVRNFHSVSGAELEGLRPTDVQPAQMVRSFVYDVFRMDKSFRGGYALEWRRLTLRRAAALVSYVDAFASVTTDQLDATQSGHDMRSTSNGGSTSGHGHDSSPRASSPQPDYLDMGKIRQMKQTLNLPSEDLDLLLAAAELLYPGTYNKVRGDPAQIAAMDRYLKKSLGVG